jgi:multicomponent Na+:H+ antiporter subunit A
MRAGSLRSYTWLALVPFALALVCLSLLGAAPRRIEIPWVPSLGVNLALYVDGLALQFLLLISGIGTAVFVYAAAYLRGHRAAGRFFALLVAFLLAMVGCVTAENVVALLIFWELTSVTSFLLVGFKHEYAPARRAAQQALFTTMFGGLALLVGALSLGELAGTYSLQGIIAAAPQLRDHPRLPATLACVFAGAFTKSAQWPFHFWLPNAMAAPTPASAYLHSATMVKLGIYLLARLKPAFGEIFLWEATLVTIGALTAMWAMVLTLRERDLKRILAWSTVAALGTLFLLIGLPGAGAAEATAAFLVAHALYKAPLFFVAGNLDHCTGTRSIDHLAAMSRRMPLTALAAALAALSMAAVPLSFGYVAKDLIAIAKAEGLAFEWVSYATFAVNALTVAVAAVAAVRVFWHRGGSEPPAEVHEASSLMIAAPLVVAGVGIVLGAFPALAESMILGSAQAMLPHGVPPLGPLAREGATIAATTGLVFVAGAVVFAMWDRLHDLLKSARWLDRFGFASWHDRLMKGIPVAARFVTTRIQHGSVPGYLAVLVAFFVSALAGAMAVASGSPWPRAEWPHIPIAAATGFIVLASGAVSLARDSFVIVLVSGLAGFGIALLAVFVGAPDVAFTQFTAEVAFVVVAAAVILRIRSLGAAPVRDEARALRGLLALVTGGTVAVLILLASAIPFDHSLSRYFGEVSYPEARGRNVVNVILVDFRAFDTLGEIFVIFLTMLAVGPLLRLLARRAEREESSL